MNRLQALFLVLLLGFVTVMWLGTGRVPPPSIVEAVPSVVQPVPLITQTTQTTQITRIEKPLIVPVAGVRPDQLLDTFSDSRSEGRTHDAIDIMAPAETPVLAAADGTIQKLWLSERGGTSIYQLSGDQKMIFYYAHLARYADGLTEGKQVRQGETIAYVGDTGNAGIGNYHLHFSIAMVSDPKRYWEGTNINPYPLLHK
jgi:murein DD-endopeptidase MepM/ murein hydrolase activator NlpD